MRRKIFITFFIAVSILAISFIFKTSEVKAAEEDNWLKIEYQVTNENLKKVYESRPILAVDITLMENGEPVNGSVPYVLYNEKNSETPAKSGNLRFTNGKGTTNFSSLYGLLVLQLPNDTYSYKVDRLYRMSSEQNHKEYNATITPLTPTEGSNNSGDNYIKYNVTIEKAYFTISMKVSGIQDIPGDEIEYPVSVRFYPHEFEQTTPITYSGSKSGTLEKTGSDEYRILTSLKNNESVTIEFPDSEILWGSDAYNAYGVGLYEYFQELNGGITLPQYEQRGMGTSSLMYTYPLDKNEGTIGINMSIFRGRGNQFVIKKQFEGIGIDPDKEFKFKIKASVPYLKDPSRSAPITGTYEGQKNYRESYTISFDENGIAYVTLKANELFVLNKFQEIHYGNNNEFWTVTWDGLCFPPDTVIEIEEIDNEDYDVQVSKNSISAYSPTTRVYADRQEFTFTNTRKFTGNLSVDNKSNQKQRATIKIIDGADDLPLEYPSEGIDGNTIVFDDNLEKVVELDPGQSIKISGLPHGAKYTVSIEDESGNTTVIDESGNITEDGALAIIKNKEEEKPQKEDNNNSKENQKSNNVQTGDAILISVAGLVIAISIVIVTFITQKRSNKNEKDRKKQK